MACAVFTRLRRRCAILWAGSLFLASVGLTAGDRLRDDETTYVHYRTIEGKVSRFVPYQPHTIILAFSFN